MNLRAVAESDLSTILENENMAFGWPITLTNPAGDTLALTGASNDIAQLIDPDTGQAVSGRLATVALRISTILNGGFTLPVGISEAAGRPWLVEFNDINGAAYKFKISSSSPDRMAGVITCTLEIYK